MIRSVAAIAALTLLVSACADAEEDADVTLATDSVPTAPAAVPASGMDQPTGMGETAQLEAIEGSGVGGEVTVTDRGEQSQVMVRLTGAPADSNHPGHIHTGTCAAVGGVVQPLEPVTTDATGTGSMTTDVAIPAATLMNGEHIVVYHGTGGRPITCAAVPTHAM